MIVTLSLVLSILVSFLFTMTKCVDVKIGGTLFSQIDLNDHVPLVVRIRGKPKN